MKAIYKREVSSYFNSMTGWVFVAVLTFFIGIYFFVNNLFSGYPYFSVSLNSVLVVFMVVIPVLTMRSLADERHSKTDQLLLTAPVPVTAVVLGKYFAMLTVFAVPVVIACLCPLIIALNGSAFLLADYCSILAFFLLGAVEIAVGMLVSSLTESQIIAFISTFGILLLLYLWDGILSFLPGSALSGMIGILLILTLIVVYIYHMTKNWMLAAGIEAVGSAAALIVYFVKSSLYENLLTKLLGRLALADVFMNISSSNIVDVSGLLLYVSILIIFVFLTIQTIQKRRWS